MKILLVGHNGILGSIFKKNITCDVIEHKYPNEEFINKVKSKSYDLIINCAVNKKSCKQTNVDLPLFLSKNTKRLVHYSSDAVFSGSMPCDHVYDKDDPDPLTDYGKEKLQSECLGLDHLVIRTSFIDYKSEFVQKIIKEKVFFAYANYHWCGLCAFQVFEKTIELITLNKRGIYNLFSNQAFTKYQLARLVSEKYKGAEIKPLRDPFINRKIKSDFLINLDLKFL